jgi:hypothetical protein
MKVPHNDASQAAEHYLGALAAIVAAEPGDQSAILVSDPKLVE